MATIHDRSIEVCFGPAGLMIYVPHDLGHKLLEEIEDRGGPGPAFTELRDAIALRLAIEMEDEDDKPETYSAEEMGEVLVALRNLLTSHWPPTSDTQEAMARARGIIDQAKAKGLL